MLHAVASHLASPLRLPVSRGRIPALEGLRGLAVLMVFLVHHAAFLEPWMGPSPIWAVIWRVLFTGGQLGVELFFTISGFLIYGMLMHATLSPLEFLRRRVRRIYPVFLAVFVLYLTLSMVSPGDSRLPAGSGPAALYIAENLLLLPGLFPIDPVITASWTLSYELAFYLLAPLLVSLLGLCSQPRATRVGVWLLVTCALLPTGPHVRTVLFVAGILIWEAVDAAKASAQARRHFADLPAILAFLGMIAVIVAFNGATSTKTDPPPNAWTTLVAAAGCGALAFAAIGEHGAIARVMCSAPLRWLGNLSYSFYLIQSVALRCIIEALRHVLPPAAGPAPWLLPALVFVTFAAAAMAALILFETVERPLSLTPRRSRRPPIVTTQTAP